jgi:hypothetical protein
MHFSGLLLYFAYRVVSIGSAWTLTSVVHMSRHKKTRAIRRQLTQEQLTKKTLKAKKKAQHFPMRKYAVKA